MNRFAATTLLVSLFAWVGEARSAEPSYSVRITRAGLDGFFDRVAEESVAYATKSPSSDIDLTVSGVDLKLKALRISELERPQLTYTLQGPDKFAVHVNVPRLVIQGPVHASRPKVVSPQQDDGNIAFNFSNATVDLSFTLGESENGIPKVSQSDCAAKLGPVKVNTQDFREKFAVEALSSSVKEVRPIFTPQLCSLMKKVLSENMNQALGGIPNGVRFSKDLQVKGQLKPVITQDSLQVSFFEKPATKLSSPLSPARCDMGVGGSPQARLTVSDALFNNALSEAHKNGALNSTFLSSSPGPSKILALNCNPQEEESCLGNVAPAVAEKYGEDASVELQMKTTVAPTLEFKDGQAAVKANWQATMFVTRQLDKQRTLEANIVVTISGSLQTKVQGATAYARVTLNDVQIKIEEPAHKKWEEKIKNTFKILLETYINDDLLKGGLPLPSGLKVDGASIKFVKHCAQASGSLSYPAAVNSDAKGP
ncbi:hypothetical protein [Corallococcus llansteffanensis]|nr:hypothetical protein [Corallococcus llansteffanensis]